MMGDDDELPPDELFGAERALTGYATGYAVGYATALADVRERMSAAARPTGQLERAAILTLLREMRAEVTP